MDVDEPFNDLDSIANALEDLHLSSADTARTSQAVTVLADASKYDLTARQRLADPDILGVLVEVIECSIDDSLETVDLALRCIGNACIDNNSTRREVTSLGFSWALRCLQSATPEDHATAEITAKVLYNICSDYEPAQQLCFEQHVHHELIHLLQFQFMPQNESRHVIIELLFWICTHKPKEADAYQPIPAGLLSDLLKLPALYNNGTSDTEDFAMLLETCLTYVRSAREQQALLELDSFGLVWNLLLENEDMISRIDGLGNQNRLVAVGGITDESKLLIPLSTSLVWCLSDMAASPAFGERHALTNDWIQQNLDEVIAGAINFSPRHVSAACQVLGNLVWAKSEAIFQADVSYAEVFLQGNVLQVVLISDDSDVLYSAAGLLIQLTRLGSGVCEAVAYNNLAQVALEKLCRHRTPQVKQAGIKLLRALGKENRDIQERYSDLAREVTSSSSTTTNGSINGEQSLQISNGVA